MRYKTLNKKKKTLYVFSLKLKNKIVEHSLLSDLINSFKYVMPNHNVNGFHNNGPAIA